MTTAEKDIDPSDIGKHPDVIKAAQADMAQTDVLVCGKCHNVFHFVELFREHKTKGCTKDSSLRECRETKPKVWAFLLWKASQLNQSDESNNVNSWKLYQTWVKMDDAIRETWVVAGRTIQSFGKMGAGSLQEMPVKITKTVVDTSVSSDKKDLVKKSPQAIMRPAQQTTTSTPTAATKTPLATKGNQILPKTRIAKRSINDSIQEDEIVEKILAKRFNPRKKQYEYLVKWEKFSHEQNTWEELSHFDQCKHLLDYFEEQLARQKEQRAKFQQIAQNKANAAAASAAASPNAVQTSPASGRPIRSSKSKAIDQVKQWCASDDDNGSLKRKNQSSADDDADDENQTDDADDDFSFTAKKLKTSDNLSVQQALIKAGSTGNVRIMPLNQRPTTAAANKINIAPKVLNGGSNTVATATIKQNSAEIVITKDSKGGTGVVKKPGATINNKNNSGEAKIRVLAKGESVPSGVVRIGAQGDWQPNIVTNSRPAVLNRSPVVSNAAAARSPNAIAQQKVAGKLITQNKLTPVQKTQQQQKRFSLSPEGASTVHNRTTITRVVRSNPSSTKTTPETGKIVTYRTADGKLVRRSFPPGVSPRLNTAKPPAVVKPVNDDDDDDDHIADPFPTELTPPEPDSPPLPMSLCPITGKVLLKAEGEKTPPPSPDPAITQHERQNSEKDGADEQHEQQQNDAEMADQAGGGGGAIQHIQPMTNEDGTPILVTGEDGTVYQIAGKNEEGQTILITQGADGEQQCVFVAADDDENGVLGLAQAEGNTELNQMMTQEENQSQFVLKQDGESTNPTQTLTVNIEGSESQDGQITAEVVQAELPSPGGTRRVVLLLPDGNLMMTEIDEEQYKSLNLVS